MCLAPCLIAYWRYGNWLGPVKCPVCRTFVTVLLNCFSEADPEETGRREALADINDYNRRFSGEPRPVRMNEGKEGRSKKNLKKNGFSGWTIFGICQC